MKILTPPFIPAITISCKKRTFRQSVGIYQCFWPFFYCACIVTAISEHVLKILTPPLDFVAPEFLLEKGIAAIGKYVHMFWQYFNCECSDTATSELR